MTGDTVTVHGQPFYVCPEPLYETGMTYLVRLRPSGDRLTLQSCREAEEARSRAAVEDIDALGEPTFRSRGRGRKP